MPDGVKSAIRVLDIFEYYDSIQRESSVMEVARALDIPQSSTSGLMRSLADRGYLIQDVERKTFVPTARLTRLGAWVAPALAPDGAVIALMNDLSEQTGETIILGALSGEVVRYIHVVPATTALRLHVGPDTARPIATSGMGRVLMATLPPERVREIVQRHNASQTRAERRLNLPFVMRDLAAIRQQGYSVSNGRITKAAGVVSVVLPTAEGTQQLALGIGGLGSAIQAEKDRLFKLMRQAITAHLGGGRRAPTRQGRA